MRTLKSEGCTLSSLCRLLGVSRQSYYQRGEAYYQQEVFRALVYEYVVSLREDMPRLGCHKLYEKSKLYFGDSLPFGRDAFFDILREKGLMLKSRKRYRPRTTDSNHLYPRYPNLLKGKDLTIDSSCRVWVSDITYIPLEGEGRRFCYLSLVTDAYSRKIVGWRLGENLQYRHTEEALRMAINESKEAGFQLEGLIHHSDRGGQYAYPEYTKLLTGEGGKISMTQSGDPKENALAERVNGILKTEWLNYHQYHSYQEVYQAVEKAICLYNTERPHMALGMKMPVQLHIPPALDRA
ncbi:IS3 family transposase [Bacteroidales bacterium OttesenSCG-928-J19]|nr:IS3 family transposase [Bacteroidales bacterium OttesenSCG-928-J19]